MKRNIEVIRFLQKSGNGYGFCFTFLFLLHIITYSTELYANDSIDSFNKTLSHQSSLPIVDQIAISYQAEDYAKKKGNVYAAYSYAAYRCYLFFLSDKTDSCKSLANRICPEIEKELRETADNTRWKILLTDCYAHLCSGLIYEGKLDTALSIYQKLLNRFEKDRIPEIQSRCLNGIGVVFAYRQLYDIAENYFKKSQTLSVANNLERGEFLATSNLGALYFSQGEFKQALPYCTRAYQIADQAGYQGQARISSCMSMGSLYMGMNKFDLADPYFTEAIEVAKRGHYTWIQSYAESAYVRNLLFMGLYGQAEKVALGALKNIEGKKRYGLESDLLESLSLIYEKQDNPAQALHYMRKYSVIQDSVVSLESQKELLDLEYRYDVLKKEKEAQERLNDLALAKAQAKNRILWIAVLVACLGLLVISLILLARHVHKLHEKTSQVKEESRKHILHAEQALENKNKELATDALRFLRLNNLQSAILDALKKLKSEFPMKGRQTLAIREIENLARQIASEKEWQDFQFYFEQVDKDFLKKLSNRFPDLTPSEKHLCVLFNLSLSNKDVANLTGKTLQSVGMAKFRLRSKLGLDSNTDLSEFLQSL